MKANTYEGQLRDGDGHDGHEVDEKGREIVMGIVRAEQEQDHGHAEQELLGRRVLVAVVDLLPHVEVVVGARVEVEGNAAHVVEHDVRAQHVRDVRQRPRRLLRHARQGGVYDLQADDQDDVDGPCS